MLQKEIPHSNWLIKDDKKSIRSKSVDVKLPLSKDDELTMKKLIDFVRMSQDKIKNKDHLLRPAVGLAAPQININKKMYYIKIVNNKKIIEHGLINPKIIGYVKKRVALSDGEGCLSVDKNHEGFIERSYKVILTAYDYFKQKEIKIVAKSYEAIVIQHEQDHLNGKLYYDLLNKIDPWQKNNETMYI